MLRMIWAFFSLALLLVPSVVSASDEPSRHALLIGISDYQQTGLHSLPGVENDIQLMEDLLSSDRFGFSDNISVILNEAATHSGLQGAFEDLLARMNQGDMVYIHYSGHGSYTRDLNGDELSGEDQTWVSYGSRQKDDNGVAIYSGVDAYDVLDDELNQWLAPIFAKAGQVVLVSDSCHSGSMTRGAATLTRAAPLDARDHPLGSQKFPSVDLSNGIIIGAARDNEAAGEFLNDEGISYGLFSWFWGSALEGVKEGETWRDLFARAAVQVNQWRKEQMPQIKGEQSDQAVFGGEIEGLPPRVAVKSVDVESQLASLPVGSLAGVTVGSIYRLYDSTAKPGTELPSLEITSVKPFYSIAQTKGAFKSGDLVIEESHAYLLEPIPVFVDADFSQDLDIVTVLRDDLGSGTYKGYSLAQDKAASRMVLYVVRPGSASERFDKGAELPESVAGAGPEVWVLNDTGTLWHQSLRFPMTDSTKGRKSLNEALTKLARVREMTNLASDVAPEFEVKVTVWRQVEMCPESSANCFSVEGQFFRLQREVAIEELAQHPPLLDELLTFSLHNTSDEDYYAYLVDIGPSGEIFAIFPTSSGRTDDALVRAGQLRDTREEAGMVASEAGTETLKLLVSLKPININLLEQAGLTRLAGTRGNFNPLESLLDDAVSGTRGKRYAIGKGEWGAENYTFSVK